MIKNIFSRLFYAFAAPSLILFFVVLIAKWFGVFDPMLVKDFKSGEQLTFSTKDHPRNFGVDISFKYPKHWGFEAEVEDMPSATGISLKAYYKEKTRMVLVLAYDLPVEITSLPEKEKKYFTQRDSWMFHENNKKNGIEILKAEKYWIGNYPCAFLIVKDALETVSFSVEIIYEDKLFKLASWTFPLDAKSATYDMKTEEALFKTICDTVKIKKIN